MSYMFSGDKNLTTILISSSFNANSVTNSTNMFYQCNSIIGGNGTTYDSNYVDKTYARLDVTGTPGYFSSN